MRQPIPARIILWDHHVCHRCAVTSCYRCFSLICLKITIAQEITMNIDDNVAKYIDLEKGF